MKMRLIGMCLLGWMIVGNVAWLRAEIKPYGTFTDNAVLQRGVKLPVWGTTDKTDTVKVSFAGQEVSAQPIEGKWRVEFTPLEANNNPATLTIAQGDAKLELKNILVGDVWVCGGQSNMSITLSAVDAKEAIAAAGNDKLRLFVVFHRQGEKQPKFDIPDNYITKELSKWSVSSPESVKDFSAVGYFFGQALQSSLNVPIGMLNSNIGGTSGERWLSKESIEASPVLREMNPAQVSADLWNGMIVPLLDFPIHGVIWYQGEGNASRAWQYRTLLPTLIQCWRDGWKNLNMPFLIVQLAPFQTDDPWPELREAQLFTSQTVPNTGLAVITDVGDKKDIHPKRKQEVGERLALAARGIAYGQKIVYSGPIFDKLAIHADNAVLTFKHIGSGLVAKDGELRGFMVAGEDGKFHDAKAEIVGDTVIAWSDKVRRVRAVRYGWSSYPEVNLWNKDGLPASPFRTDDYPLTTRDNK